MCAQLSLTSSWWPFTKSSVVAVVFIELGPYVLAVIPVDLNLCLPSS